MPCGSQIDSSTPLNKKDTNPPKYIHTDHKRHETSTPPAYRVEHPHSKHKSHRNFVMWTLTRQLNVFVRSNKLFVLSKR